MQQQAEGIGPEVPIAQAVRLQRVLEVLDPVLSFAAVDVAVVDGQRRLGPRGDHKPGVRSFGEGFGFEDHPPFDGPTAGLVLDLTGQTDLHPALGLALGLGTPELVESTRLKPRPLRAG